MLVQPQPPVLTIPYLHMALWLHEASHDSEATQKLTRVGMGRHARNNGVVGPLARCHHIGVGGVKDKIVPAVLEVKGHSN